MAKGKVYIAGQLVGVAEHAIVLQALLRIHGDFELRRVHGSPFELYLDMRAATSPGGEFLIDHLSGAVPQGFVNPSNSKEPRS